MATKHNHKPNFGRRVADCDRCIELDNGASTITWNRKDTQPKYSAHQCSAKCSTPICTANDW
jgi:hypothetical protein